jgi:pyrimidine-specific ribonucleoside hydrolase
VADTSPIPVILDVDTGVDDALAILLATRTPELALLGVSCVAGNVDTGRAVANTLAVLHAAGRDDVPVARGASRPLLEPHRPAGHVHGASGLGDVPVAAAPRGVTAECAVRWLRDTLHAATAPVTIVALAPLTNLALLLRTYPGAAERIGRIVFMGGAAAVPGNATPLAEFNTWHDPEAAAIVLQSDIPLTMYGLDVFYTVAVSRADATTLAGRTDPAASLAGALLLAQLDRAAAAHTTLGDAGAVGYLLAPHAFTTRTVPVEINLVPGPGRGHTIVDLRQPLYGEQPGTRGPAGRPVDVCLQVDPAPLTRLFLDRLRGDG